MQTCRNQGLKRKFQFVHLGFCEMILLLWIRVPKDQTHWTVTWYPLGGLSQNSGHQRPDHKEQSVMPVPLLRWDEDDRCEAVSNEKGYQTFSKRSFWVVDVFNSWFLKLLWTIQFGSLWRFGHLVTLHRCHCPMMIKDGAKETLSHKTTHQSEGTHDPWKEA